MSKKYVIKQIDIQICDIKTHEVLAELKDVKPMDNVEFSNGSIIKPMPSEKVIRGNGWLILLDLRSEHN